VVDVASIPDGLENGVGKSKNHDILHGFFTQIVIDAIDLVFIENVGNLVCPASFDLGQHRDVVLLSVPEGDDKPAKYPVMFRAAELLLLSKCDLLPVLDDFQPENARRNLQALANAAPVIELSAKTGAGMEAWLQWLRTEHAALQSRQASEQAAAGAP